MRHIFLSFGFFLLSTLVFAQPANDNCATAQNLGTLPAPAACSGAGPQLGAPVNVAGTNVAATPASPYIYQTGCSGAGGTTMAVPANDVWYTFTASSYQFVVNITSTFANPNVAFYSGTCGALGGGVGGCAVGAGGSVSLTVEQMVIGQTYYIQVSGNTGQSGTFNMSVQNNKDCQDCLNASTLTVTPLPTAGTYAPGTVVNFCYHISQYTQVNTNWLHGVQVALGSGWNAASIVPTPPVACQGSGQWLWQTSVTSSATGTTYPQGFYFDTVDAGTNPGNNFGDNCSGAITAANWNFCFTVQVATTCNPGSDLSITINTSGDGESGSWSSLGCADDPATVFQAVGACCPPTMSSTPSCTSPTTGTATATPVGAAGPYNYTWTNAGGTVVSTSSGVAGANTVTGLAPGTYTVSIVDANGCVSTNTVTVATLAAPVINVNSPTICNGASTTLTATGGVSYTWSPSGGLSATTGSSVTATPASTTVYTVTGTNAGGCSSTATSTVTVNPNPVVNVNSPTYCAGSSAVLTATGATTYTWSPAAGLSATTGSSVTTTSASSTSYTVTGTTAGCTGTATSTVTVNPLPVVAVNSPTYCTGSSAVLTATGASTYTWSPATGLSATTGSSVTTTSASSTSYNVTGTSAAGCVNTATSTVTVNPLPVVAVNSPTYCTGASAVLTATGASTYTWSPAAGLSATTGSSVTTTSASSTSYNVTGTSAAGCVNTATSTVTVNPLPVVAVNSPNICPGGSAILTATGASTYTWSPAGGLSATTGSSVTANPASTTVYTVTGTSAAGCVNTATSTVTLGSSITLNVNSPSICIGTSTPLTVTGATIYTWSPAGGLSATTGSSVTANPAVTTVYTISGTDASGCTGTTTSTVTVNPLPTVNVNSPSICPGASAVLTATGASTYSWTPSGGLSATTGASVNANPAATTVYTVTGTDANGCVNTATSTVTVNPNPTINVNSGLICLGSSMVLTATGGSTYTWSPSTGLSATTGTSVTANPVSTSVYTVTGTDVNGCVNTATGTVTVDQVVITGVAVTDVSCFGLTDGTITVTAAGATQFSDDNGGTYQVSNTFNEGVGNYTIIVQNANGCADTSVATINEPALLTLAAGTLQDETCFGDCDGQVAGLPAGGTTPYGVTWAGPTPGTGLSLSNVCPGVYTATVTDANGCTATANTTVNAAIAVTIVSVTPTNPTCNGGTNGQLVIVGSATVTQYSIDNGATFQATGTFTGLAAGPYIVVVTDANGCSATQNITLTQPTAVSVTSSPDVNICVGASTVISATGAGGTGPYNYQWNDPTNATTSSVSVTPAGTTTYNVVVTDANGCGPVNESVTVTVGAPLNVIALTDQTICPGASANITANASGGSGVYTYTWTNDQNASVVAGQNQTVSPSTTTIYTVTLTDNCGTPSATDNVTISVYTLPLVTFTSDVNSGCSPVAVNFTNTMAVGTITNCTWDFGDGTTSTNCNDNHVYSAPGCYNVTFSAETVPGNCPVTGTINNMVCVFANPVADFTANPQPTDLYNTNINFTNTSVGASTYTWNFAGLGVDNSTNPFFIFPSDSGGIYPVCLAVATPQGCVDSVCHNIVINGEFLIYVPNAFTPDGDGLNDVFTPILRGEDPKSYELMIFNRWGELIFTSNNKLIGWDGTHNNAKSKEDVYVWKVKVKKKMNQDKVDYIGHVTLLR